MAPERSRDRLNIAVASARAVTRSTIPGLTPHAGRTPPLTLRPDRVRRSRARKRVRSFMTITMSPKKMICCSVSLRVGSVKNDDPA